MNQQDDVFMRLAIKKAQEGVDLGQTPFGACIVRNGNVISLEHNVVWSSTDITAHAEIHAIRQACLKTNSIDLTGSVVYSTCEPCPMCFSACHWARIDRIVYGVDIATAQSFGFNELAISNVDLKKISLSDVEISSGVCEDENRELFDYWKTCCGQKVY